MNRVLYVQETMPDAELINLFFSSDAVTLRALVIIRSVNDFVEKILKRRLGSPDFYQKASQTETPLEGDDMKKEIQLHFDKAKATALSPSVLLRDTSNLVNKYVLVNKNLYWIASQNTTKVPSQLWKPYNEVCLVLQRNISQTPNNPILSFVERNELTSRSHESYGQFHKRIRQFGAYIAFRWIVLPNTTLLTAPLIANPIQGVISNVKLGTPILKASSGQANKQQIDQANKVVQEFFRYWIPTLIIEGPDEVKANGTVEFVLKALHHGEEICKDNHEYYLQAISGFAPQKQIEVEEGYGKFRMIALGLRKGETMRFKINDWNWSGKAEKTLKIV